MSVLDGLLLDQLVLDLLFDILHRLLGAVDGELEFSGSLAGSLHLDVVDNLGH